MYFPIIHFFWLTITLASTLNILKGYPPFAIVKDLRYKFFFLHFFSTYLGTKLRKILIEGPKKNSSL